MRIVRSPEAIADLDAIWVYIAAHDFEAADRIVDQVVAATNRLADYPESGSPRFHIRSGLRSITVGKYIVYYVVEPEKVRLVRVMHGARDVPDVSAI